MNLRTALNLLICLCLLSLAGCAGEATPTETAHETPTAPTTPTTPPTTTAMPPASYVSPVPTPQLGLPQGKPGEWQTLTNGNFVNDLVVAGDDVWAATSGGVVRWNTASGTYRKYTTADGLVDNSAIEIVRDTRGNIWAASAGDGVSRFNGEHWLRINTQNWLLSDDIITIAADAQGSVWISYYWGVARYDGKNWQNYTMDELSTIDVIFPDSRGHVWFGSRTRGVTRYDGQNWQTFTRLDGLGGSGVNAIFEDGDGNLWFGSYNALSRFDGTTWDVKVIEVAQPPPKPYIQQIIQDSSGDIWVRAYPDMLLRYDESGEHRYTTADGLPASNTTLLFINTEGDICAVTDGGIVCYQGGRWQPFSGENGLPGAVRTVLKDSPDSLWLGTGAGLAHYDGSAWHTFITSDYAPVPSIWAGSEGGFLTDGQLPVNAITALAEDQEGTIWIGMADGSVSCYGKGGLRSFAAAETQAADDILSIIPDSHGRTWALTEMSLSCYDGDRWRLITAEDGIAASRVSCMFEDASGNMWFGTDDGGVSRFDGESWHTFTAEDGLGKGSVAAIAQDDAGNLWFGGENVSRFDGTEWWVSGSGSIVYIITPGRNGEVWFALQDANLLHFNGEKLKTVTYDHVGPWVGDMLMDSRGNLWISTLSTGDVGKLSRYNGEDWRVFTFSDGLAGNKVHCLIEDHSGNIWTGGTTCPGLSCYDGEQWQVFTAKDGLGSNHVNCMLVDSRGNIWFGTRAGLTVYFK